MACRRSLPKKDMNHPKDRIFDPTFLDSNYMSIPTRTISSRPSAEYTHLFVYNPEAGVMNARMVSYPTDDDHERASILASFPNVLSSPADFTNPNFHVLTSVMVVETSAALMTTRNLPGGANPPLARFHWRTTFGPMDCSFNAIGVIPDRHAFPASPKSPLSMETCARFARIYAIGKALEKVVEIFAEAKTSRMSQVQRVSANLPWVTAESLRQMRQVLLIVDDLLLMEWLGKDDGSQTPSEIVSSLCEEGSQVDASIEYKGIHLIVWIRSLLKQVEVKGGVEILFWGINEATGILKQIREESEVRSRSPTPELPSLSSIKLRHSPKTATPSLRTIGGKITASNLAASSLALKTSLAKIALPPRSESDGSIPSSPTTSVKSNITTPNTASSTPIPIPTDKNSPFSPHVAYILSKYLPQPTDDKAITTDREIRARPSQVPPASQLQKVQKQRRDAMLREAQAVAEIPRTKRKHNIIEVFIGPDGQTLDRSQVNARWKGEKRRVAVELPTQAGASGIAQPSGELNATNLQRLAEGNLSKKRQLEYGPSGVDGAGVIESRTDGVKTTGSDTNSTLDEEENKATSASGGPPAKRKRGWNLLKGARAGTSGRGRKAATQRAALTRENSGTGPNPSKSSTASKTSSVERVLPSRGTTTESRTRASSQQSSS